MNNKKTITFWTSLLIGSSLPLMVTGQEAAPPPNPAESSGVQEKVAELEEEFRSISSKLNEVERQALQEDEVAKSKENLEELVEETVIETEPELEEAVEKRSKYAKYIETVQEGGELPEDVDLNEVYSEYNAVHQKVMPVEQRVMQKESVQEEYQKYQEKLVQEMRAINGEVEELMERQREIRNEYQELMAQNQQQ